MAVAMIDSVNRRSMVVADRLYSRVVEKRANYWIALALAGSVALLLAARLLNADVLAHDDAITILGVTCNQGRYAASAPAQHWVSAADWQSYWTLKSPGCFGTIRADLAHDDIHPPLYFWLLHAWLLVFGVSAPAALALNFVIVAVTAVVILETCRLLAVPTPIVCIIGLTWGLTMATRMAAASVRQYSLLGLFSALLLLVTVLWFTRDKPIYLAALVPVITGGMLTQYLFFVPATVALVLIGMALLAGRRYRELGFLLAGYAVAAVLVVAANPGFADSMHRAGRQAQAFSWPAVPLRLAAVLSQLIEPFAPLDPAYQFDAVMIAVCALTAIIVLPMLVQVVRWVLKMRHQHPPVSVNSESVPMLMFLGCAAAIVALFLMFISPEHVMRPIYLYFLTPFLFVGLAVASQRSAKVIASVTTLFVYQFIGVAVATSFFMVAQTQHLAPPPGRHSAIVLDSDRRGIVPPTLWWVPPTALTYAGSQSDLLRHFPNLDAVGDRDLYYVSRIMLGAPYGNSTTKRNKILKQFSDRGYHARFVGTVAAMGGADVYRLTRQ